ncbi:MAG: hypothetical protein Q7V43_19190 [Myxococcales bacterium]|nr:hypothetical protein [Myxococcales bacterium]
MSERALLRVRWRSGVGVLSIATPDTRAASSGPVSLTASLEGVATSGRSALRWCPDAQGEGLAALTLDDRAALHVQAPEGCAVEVPDGVTVTRWGDDAALVSFAGRLGESWIGLRRGERVERLAVHVESPLLQGREAHRAMVDDLLAESLALSEEGPSETALTHARDAGGAMRLLVAWLLRSGTLERAMALVARAPLRGAAAVQRVVPWLLARRVRMDELASNPAVARGDDPSQVLVRAEEPALRVDTPENRAVASLLRTVASVMAEPEAPPALAEALAEVLALADRVGLRALPSMGAATTLAGARTAGYRELSAIARWLEGLAVADDPADAAVRLALDDSALLYERWCARELSRALGLPSTLAPGASGQCSLDGVALRVWCQPARQAVPSYGLSYRPDLMVEAQGARVVFDAKFRADAQGAVEKMHAYRDAIDGCVAAYALMPCGEAEATRHPAPGGGGVGVVALRPERGDGVEGRRAALRAAVAAALASVRGRSRAPGGRPG